MSREKFEYEAGKALNLPTNIIELARKGDGYDHAFDSMNIMQPLNGWWHWWKAGAASMQSERDQLAAQLAAVAAENAALKSGVKYFSYSEMAGFVEHNSADLAMKSADADLAAERDEASSEGWSEETDTICWGVILQKAVENKFEKPSEENGWIGWSDYALLPNIKTPATDAFIAEQRAVGVEMFAEACSTANNGREIHPDIEEIKAFAAQLRNEVKV